MPLLYLSGRSVARGFVARAGSVVDREFQVVVDEADELQSPGSLSVFVLR